MSDVQRAIAARVAAHLGQGDVVNLGIGIPTLVADYLPPDNGVYLESENGVLGVGPAPQPADADPNLINASKSPVTVLAGASYFSSSASFGLIRGGHITTAVLGALQVDRRGRIANWSVPGSQILGVGGAMDLLVGARRVIVASTHTTRAGQPKIVAECTYPLSADRQVDLVVTEAATFAVRRSRLTLIEVADGFTTKWVREHTDAPFACDDGLTATQPAIGV
jgi:3-oxoacid CoA-transferase B subunit